MNGSDPEREIGFGSVARAGEAELPDMHALLDPLHAPNGRPPRCRARPPGRRGLSVPDAFRVVAAFFGVVSIKL